MAFAARRLDWSTSPFASRISANRSVTASPARPFTREADQAGEVLAEVENTREDARSRLGASACWAVSMVLEVTRMGGETWATKACRAARRRCAPAPTPTRRSRARSSPAARGGHSRSRRCGDLRGEHRRRRAGAPAVAGRHHLARSVGEAELKLRQEAARRRPERIAAAGRDVAGVPAVADVRAQHVRAAPHQAGDVVDAVEHAVAEVGAFGRQQRIADTQAVEERLVGAERRRIEPRADCTCLATAKALRSSIPPVAGQA